jgi:hypothetical protein
MLLLLSAISGDVQQICSIEICTRRSIYFILKLSKEPCSDRLPWKFQALRFAFLDMLEIHDWLMPDAERQRCDVCEA